MAKKKKKTKKKTKRVDLDVRPHLLFRNYDYGGPEDATDISPGTGLYSGFMGKYKSVADFLKKKRKQRKKVLESLLNNIIYCKFSGQDLKYLKSDSIRKSISGFIKKANYEEYSSKIEELAKDNPNPFDDWFEGSDRIYIPFSMERTSDGDGVDERDEVVALLREKYPEKCKDIDFIAGYCGEEGSQIKIGKLLGRARKRELSLIKDNLLNIIKDKVDEKLYKEIKAVIEKSITSNKLEGLPASDYITDIDVIAIINNYEKEVRYWNDMIGQFTSSPMRVRKGQDYDYFVVISQNPHDIAQMSTGRSWSSCMTLGEGSYHNNVFCEVREGGLIAYLIKGNDKEIKKPLSRILIRRFENANGDSIAIPEDVIYGDDIEEFTQAVKKWLDSKQANFISGIYKMKGGSYSDSFSGGAQVFIPEDEKNILSWFEGPEEVEGAVRDYWVVTDNLNDYRDELNSNYYEGVDSELQPPKIFYNEDDARSYKELMRYSDFFDTFVQHEDERSQHAYEDYMKSEEEKTPEEIEAGIEKNEHIGHSEFSELLDDDYERFTISEEKEDHTKLVRSTIIDNILSKPNDTFSKEMINKIKDYIFTPEADIASERLKNQFISKFVNDFPELAEKIHVQKDSPISLSHVEKLLEKLSPHDPKAQEIKNEVIEDALKYLTPEFAKLKFNNDSSSKIGWRELELLVKYISWLRLLKPIPARIVSNLTKYLEEVYKANALEDSQKKRIRESILHSLHMTHTDVPQVQALYNDLLSQLDVVPRKAPNKDVITLYDIGRNIARLGENGRQFIPFFKKKYEEVKNWHPQENANSDYIAIPDDAIGGRYIGEIFVDNYNAWKLSQLQRIAYIIDSLESGKGFSTKYKYN